MLAVLVVLHQMFAQLEVVSQYVFPGENKSVSREKSLVGISDLYGFHVVLQLVNIIQSLGGVTKTLHQISPGLTPGLVRDADTDLVLSVDLQHLNLGWGEQIGLGVLILRIRIFRGLYRLLQRPAGFHYISHCFITMRTLRVTRTVGTISTVRTGGHREIKKEEEA